MRKSLRSRHTPTSTDDLEISEVEQMLACLADVSTTADVMSEIQIGLILDAREHGASLRDICKALGRPDSDAPTIRRLIIRELEKEMA